MVTALYTAATGMYIAASDIDVKANNIANIRTPGFKKFRLESADLSYQNFRRAGIIESAGAEERPVGIQIGFGAKVIGAYRILTQGNPEITANPLDLMIQGAGYFAISVPSAPNGIAYTRNGSFKKNSNGNLATTEGFVLSPIVNLPDIYDVNTINISDDGVVSAKDPTGKITIIGQVQIYTFTNEQGLESIGSNFLIETAASGIGQVKVPGIDGSGTLVQGSKEESNTDPTTELTSLIMAQRAYELNAKVIKVADETMKSTTDLKP